ncbi:HEPN domain-containing protein [Actinomyces sp. oral taxon 181]|uniref:ApeA N-terminal domain 1-containing protein n=1 Tax=Actinomyces sp. oral taxon 181 TaxID=712121 RepID=UPI0025B8D51E|nr:HEPN domain-containing protein [Actinomyces sp. oral taxon 181]MBS5749976.1 hypothetical protein [Actinomyces sp. oral taxon 181]
MANDHLNLDEAAEWTGHWWLPDFPDKRVPGILRYDGEGGLSLSLIGAFEDRIYSTPAPGITCYHEGTRTWDVIHGKVELRDVTLLDCIPISTERFPSLQMKDAEKQTIIARMGVIGVHIGGDEDEVFTAAAVSVDDLCLWAESSVFKSLLGTADGKLDGTGMLSVAPVEMETAVVNDTEYRLEHAYFLPSFEWRRGEVVGRMRDSVSIRILRTEAFALKTALEAVRLIQDLIALATHRPAGVIWMQLEIGGTESGMQEGKPLQRRRANVLYSPVAVGKHNEKAIDYRSVLFTCEMLSFQEVIPRWCDVRARLQEAINMILGLRYAPAHFVENNLLMAVGAAEALHRGLGIEEKPIPKAEFEEIRNAMLDQVPEEYRGRFKQAIRNSPTLCDRLLALAARPDQEAVRQLVPNIDHWAKRTTRARNDLAHEGKAPRHSIEELNAIVSSTSAVVILNILYELGLPAERQREIVRDNSQLKMVCEEARRWLVPPEGDS